MENSLRGDGDAFALLVKRHLPGVYGLALSMMGNTQDAEDACQEVFLNAYRALGRFQGRSSVKTWLFRITLNKCLKMRRKRARVQAAPLEESLASPNPGPEYLSEDMETIEALQEALDGLPATLRTAAVLRFARGLTYGEIANILDIPVGTVRSRLHAARQGLKRCLSAHLGGNPIE